MRVRLADPGHLPTPELRTTAEGAAAPDPASFTDGAAPDGAGGDAVITLPQGARVSGGPGAAADAASAAGGPAPIAAPVRSASPLPAAPLAGLHQPGPGGPMPVIARDGRTAFGAYSRPFTPNGKPRVALMVGGLGLTGATTRAAIERLPPEITLSFVAYADGLQGWIDQARAHGPRGAAGGAHGAQRLPQQRPRPRTR